MNSGTLRKGYGTLTPFERAALVVQEAYGKQNELELQALMPQPHNTWKALWGLFWKDNFHQLAAFAMFQASNCERMAWQFLYMDTQGEDGSGALKRAGHILLQRGRCWRLAMDRLERETGAPFSSAGKLFGSAESLQEDPVAERMLNTFAPGEVDYNRQYNVLSQMWEVMTRNADEQDAHRHWSHTPLPESDDGLKAALDLFNADRDVEGAA